MDSAERLDLLKIRAELTGHQLARQEDLIIFESVDSTNDWALSQCQYIHNLPRACLAEQQVKGRGRKQRAWYSPLAQNIYMSLAYSFNIHPSQLHGLSMVIGISLVRVLNELGISSGLKWPNDVYVGSAKIAGILIETKIKSEMEVCAAIGIGLNYDMGNEPISDLDRQWTDIIKEIEADRIPDRSQLAGKVLNQVITACELFAREGFVAFHDEWQQYDLCAGKTLDIHTDEGAVQGNYQGINEEGALVVLVNDKQHVFYAADVSIRMKD